MADPGKAPGLPLFLALTEARRAEKNFLRPATALSEGLDREERVGGLISFSETHHR